MELHSVQLLDCCLGEMMDPKMANKMVNYLVLGLDWMLDYSTEAGLYVTMARRSDYWTHVSTDDLKD